MFGVQRQVVEYQMNLSDLRRKVPSNIVQLESQIQGMKAQLEWDPPAMLIAGKEVAVEMDVDGESGSNWDEAERRTDVPHGMWSYRASTSSGTGQGDVHYHFAELGLACQG